MDERLRTGICREALQPRSDVQLGRNDEQHHQEQAVTLHHQMKQEGDEKGGEDDGWGH